MNIQAKISSLFQQLIDFFALLFRVKNTGETKIDKESYHEDITIPSYKPRKPRIISLEESWEFLSNITKKVMTFPQNVQKMICDIGMILVKMDMKYIHVIEYSKSAYVYSNEEKVVKKTESKVSR